MMSDASTTSSSDDGGPGGGLRPLVNLTSATDGGAKPHLAPLPRTTTRTATAAATDSPQHRGSFRAMVAPDVFAASTTSSVNAASPAATTPGGTRLRSEAPEYRPRNSPMTPAVTPLASGRYSAPPTAASHSFPAALPSPGPDVGTPARSTWGAVSQEHSNGNTANSHYHHHSPNHHHHHHGDGTGCFVDYILVVDFEATCEEPQPIDYVPEIIEFPVVLIDTAKRRIVSEFHSYVRPQDKPLLSAFCRSLTGITQEQVSAAPPLQTVVTNFNAWLGTAIEDGKSFIFATDGPWDMRDFMYAYSVKVHGVRFPEYFYRWIDVKEAFSDHYSCRRGKIHAMLDFFGLEFEGRLHSGIDDARNIAKIVIALLDAGCSFPTVDEIERTPPRAHLRRHHSRPNLPGYSSLHSTPSHTPGRGAVGSSPPVAGTDGAFSLPPPLPSSSSAAAGRGGAVASAPYSSAQHHHPHLHHHHAGHWGGRDSIGYHDGFHDCPPSYGATRSSGSIAASFASLSISTPYPR